MHCTCPNESPLLLRHYVCLLRPPAVQPFTNPSHPTLPSTPHGTPPCTHLSHTSQNLSAVIHNGTACKAGCSGAFKGGPLTTDIVDLEALNSAPSLNAWGLGGTGGLGLAGGYPNQAAASAIDLATSSSSGLGTAPPPSHPSLPLPRNNEHTCTVPLAGLVCILLPLVVIDITAGTLHRFCCAVQSRSSFASHVCTVSSSHQATQQS